MLRTPAVRTVATIALTVVVLVVADISCRAEKKRTLPPVSSSRFAPPRTAWREYVEGLMTAASTERKWELTVRYLRLEGKGEKVSAAEMARAALIQLRRASANWLAYYPEITRRLTLTPQDLQTLGESLESEDVYVWEETVGDARAYYSLARTRGENAQGWLLHLTGVTFQSESGFRSWFRRSDDHLRWNPQTGRFVVDRGAPETPSR